MIARIRIVSRLAQTLYAGGVPADRVAYLPHQLALLDVVAESVATGKAPSVPLSLMAGELCPFEPVGRSELDQPIPFAVVEPATGPEPETPPAPVAAAEALVEAAAEPQIRGKSGPKRIDWDSVSRLGRATDQVIAAELGVNPSAVRQARAKRGIPAHVPVTTPISRRIGENASIDWDAETRLGQVRDSDLARELGVTPGAVWAARKARDIPSVTPKAKASTPPAVTPERQAELDAIEAAVKAGKVTRITPEEAKADLEAKYRAEGVRYGYKSRAQKKGAGVAS